MPCKEIITYLCNGCGKVTKRERTTLACNCRKIGITCTNSETVDFLKCEKCRLL